MPYAASVVRNENRATYKAEIRQVAEFTRCLGKKILCTSYVLGWLRLTTPTTSFLLFGYGLTLSGSYLGEAGCNTVIDTEYGVLRTALGSTPHCAWQYSVRSTVTRKDTNSSSASGIPP
jgi:hypothetical protein